MQPDSYGTVSSRGTPPAGRSSSTSRSSATWGSCATPSPRGSRRHSGPTNHYAPPGRHDPHPARAAPPVQRRAPGRAHARAPERGSPPLGETVIRSESRITIAGTVPEVWAYVCDVGSWQEWAPSVAECWVAGGAPLEPGSKLEQRAKGPFGSTHHRAQNVTSVEAPHSVAFAGPMGTSAARWGMEIEPLDDRRTDAMMWVEGDPKNV